MLASINLTKPAHALKAHGATAGLGQLSGDFVLPEDLLSTQTQADLRGYMSEPPRSVSHHRIGSPAASRHYNNRHAPIGSPGRRHSISRSERVRFGAFLSDQILGNFPEYYKKIMDDVPEFVVVNLTRPSMEKADRSRGIPSMSDVLLNVMERMEVPGRVTPASIGRRNSETPIPLLEIPIYDQAPTYEYDVTLTRRDEFLMKDVQTVRKVRYADQRHPTLFNELTPAPPDTSGLLIYRVTTKPHSTQSGLIDVGVEYVGTFAIPNGLTPGAKRNFMQRAPQNLLRIFNDRYRQEGANQLIQLTDNRGRRKTPGYRSGFEDLAF